MTNRWTQDMPTEEGYYWLKTEPHSDYRGGGFHQFDREPVRITKHNWNGYRLHIETINSDEGLYPSELYGRFKETWWLGPMERPL